MPFPLIAAPAVQLPFQLPAFMQIPPAFTTWIWAGVILLAVLILTAKLLNWLATLFTHCPHCDMVVRKGQRICHRCFKAVKPEPEKPVRPPSPRATRPLGPMPRGGA